MAAYDWAISRQGTERFLQFRAADGKEFAISTLEKHAITYHVDHAVKIVSIVAIE